MKYIKKALPFANQADLLLARGLIADRATLIKRLEAVNYYRLSAYWYTFRDKSKADESLLPNTTLDVVWSRYVFDRQLRLLVMDAIERVEVAVRTQIVNRHVLAHGPHGYLDRAYLPGLSPDKHRILLEKVRAEAKLSREDFVTHYFSTYTSETDLPLWMAVELMTFGTMHVLFEGLPTKMKKDIAGHYGFPLPVFGSWLQSLKVARNACAHHARLWNRTFGVPPVMSDHSFPDWHIPIRIPNDKVFGLLSILYTLLKKVAPFSQWRSRLEELLTCYKATVPINFMGFPPNWTDSPIWAAPPAVTTNPKLLP